MVDGDASKLTPSVDTSKLSHFSEMGTHDTQQATQTKSITKTTYASVLAGQQLMVDSDPEQVSSPSSSTLTDPNAITFKPYSLYKGKPSIEFSEAESNQLVGKLKYVLVGKFSHGRPNIVEIKAFFSTLKFRGCINFSIYDNKHIYIECSSFFDYARIWLKLVWSIKGYSMRVFKWNPDFHPSKESIIVPVWIRIEGLPLHMFDEIPLLEVANTIGKPIKVDQRNVNRTILNSARICIELDLSKPLVDIIWVSFEKGKLGDVLEGIWARVFYDELPSFCLDCCHLGHSMEQCKVRKGKGLLHDEPVLKHELASKDRTDLCEIAANNSKHSSLSSLLKPCSSVWIKKKEQRREPANKSDISGVKDADVGATEEPLKVATKQADSSDSVTVANRFVALNDDSSHEINLQQLPQEVIQMQQLARNDAEQQATVQADAGQIAICGAAAKDDQGQNILEDIDSSQKEESQQIVDAPNATMVSAQAAHAAGQLAIGGKDVVCAASALVASAQDGQIADAASQLVQHQIVVINGTNLQVADQTIVGQNADIEGADSQVATQAANTDISLQHLGKEYRLEKTESKEKVAKRNHNADVDIVAVSNSVFDNEQAAHYDRQTQVKVNTDSSIEIDTPPEYTKNVAEEGRHGQEVNTVTEHTSSQEWQVVGKKNTKTKGVVTRSQTKNANSTWVDKVEDAQVEDQTPISTKEQTGNKATRSRRQVHRLMMRLSHRINNMSLKHVMRSELLAEMAALKEEEDSLLR